MDGRHDRQGGWGEVTAHNPFPVMAGLDPAICLPWREIPGMTSYEGMTNYAAMAR
jgi:hypothetical protein